MDEYDDRSSLNRKDETDLNMETENSVGANGSVPREVTDNVVDIPGENSSSAGNLNTATGDENTASKPNNSTDEARSTVDRESYASRAARATGPASNKDSLGGVPLITRVMICRNVPEPLCLHLDALHRRGLFLTPRVWQILMRLIFNVCSER